jgi:hypothetical protein
MKRFLIHRLGRSADKDAIDGCIRIYVDQHNNGLKVKTTQVLPGGEVLGNEGSSMVRETRESS